LTTHLALKFFVTIGSVETHLWCDGTYNNYIIANCLQSVPLKEI